MTPARSRECPECGEQNLSYVEVCRKCGRNLDSPPPRRVFKPEPELGADEDDPRGGSRSLSQARKVVGGVSELILRAIFTAIGCCLLIAVIACIPPTIVSVIMLWRADPSGICLAGFIWWIWLATLTWVVVYWKDQLTHFGDYLIAEFGSLTLGGIVVKMVGNFVESVAKAALGALSLLIGVTTMLHLNRAIGNNGTPSHWIWYVVLAFPFLAGQAASKEEASYRTNGPTKLPFEFCYRLLRLFNINPKRPGLFRFLERYLAFCSLAQTLAVLMVGAAGDKHALFAGNFAFNSWMTLFPPMGTLAVFGSGTFANTGTALFEGLTPDKFLFVFGMLPPLLILVALVAASHKVQWLDHFGDRLALFLIAVSVLPYTLFAAIEFDSRLWWGLIANPVVLYFRPLVNLAIKLILIVLGIIAFGIILMVTISVLENWMVAHRPSSPPTKMPAPALPKRPPQRTPKKLTQTLQEPPRNPSRSCPQLWLSDVGARTRIPLRSCACATSRLGRRWRIIFSHWRSNGVGRHAPPCRLDGAA